MTTMSTMIAMAIPIIDSVNISITVTSIIAILITIIIIIVIIIIKDTSITIIITNIIINCNTLNMRVATRKDQAKNEQTKSHKNNKILCHTS